MREKRPIVSFRGHGHLSYCFKTGRMPGMLVSGKTISITKQVMSDDIDDIQDPRYHIIAVGHYFNLFLVRGFEAPG